MQLTRIANLDGWNTLVAGSSGTYEACHFKNNYWSAPSSQQIPLDWAMNMNQSSTGSGTSEKWSLGSQDRTLTPNQYSWSIRVRYVDGSNPGSSSAIFYLDSYEDWITDFRNILTDVLTDINGQKKTDIPATAFKFLVKSGLKKCFETHMAINHAIKFGFTAEMGDVEEMQIEGKSPGRAGSADLTTNFMNSVYVYAENNSNDTNGYGLGTKKGEGTKYYIDNYYNVINILRDIKSTQQTYINHSGTTYKTSNTSYSDSSASAISLPDCTNWNKQTVGTSYSPTAKSTGNYTVSNNYLLMERDNNVDWSNAQWGQIPTTNCVVYDDDLIITTGSNNSISAQSWGRDGYYMNGTTPTMTNNNTVSSSTISFKSNYPKYYDGQKINYYYSQGLSLMGEGDIKIGNGAPIAKNSSKCESVKVQMKFDVYNSSGTKISTNHNLHWMISDKKFVDGAFDAAALVKIEGDSTGDININSPIFATDNATTLWLNVYATTSGNYVKINNIQVS